MNKNTLIQKHFQKKHLLKMTNPHYQKTVDTLFNWLVTTDRIENDQTSLVIASAAKQSLPTTANIQTHQDIIIAGIEEIEYCLRRYPQISFQKKVKDGETLKRGDEIAVISGNSVAILSLERTILNILQRMSGIATQTKKFSTIISQFSILNSQFSTPAGASLQLAPKHFQKSYTPFIAATRKTPWMQLDKKAVAVGGGLTHRLDLSDGILIKDNHLQILKNEYGLKNEQETVTRALMTVIARTKDEAIFLKKENLLEIEVTTKESAIAAIKTYLPVIARSSQATEAISTNHLILMLDNWKPEDVRKFIKDSKSNPAASSIIFEASGGINENNLKDWATTGVDIISSGSLTHSTQSADLSLSITSITQD